ncbi:MAG: hypothetical protein QOH89_912 [Pseudonocardiales bacterium]|nr:hypothetical protein [Pseudonocardiales bacterium]
MRSAPPGHTGPVIVGIVIVSVIVVLVVVMRWADRRDRANGHVNRGMGDIQTTMRDQRRNARLLRNPAARSVARSPHDVPTSENSRRPRRT